MTPLECEIIVGSIPAGAISRKGGSIWGMSVNRIKPNEVVIREQWVVYLLLLCVMLGDQLTIKSIFDSVYYQF